MCTSDDFRLGFIGTGNFFQKQLNVLSDFPSIHGVGCYDPHSPKARQEAERWGIPYFSDLQELIRQSDGLSISTLPVCHYESIDLIIREGKHVLATRPLVSNLLQAEHVKELVKEANVKCYVFSPYRVHPFLSFCKEHLSDPMYFEVHRDYEPSTMDSKNLIYDGMIDYIDLICAMVHSPVKEVRGSGISCRDIHRADVVYADILFFNGESARLTLRSTEPSPKNTLKVYKKQAYVEVDFLQQTIRLATIQENQQWVYESQALDVPPMGAELDEQTIRQTFVSLLEEKKGNAPAFLLANAYDEYRTLAVATEIADRVMESIHYAS